MDTIDKALAALAFLFIAMALVIIAITPSATGYEVSLYDAYPLHFWLLSIASIACGIGILLRQTFAPKKSEWWMVGFIIISFTNIVLLLLPMFRGYALYGLGDTVTHLGFAKDILNSGHIGETNWYPILHIAQTTLVQVSGVTLESTYYLLVILFYGIYTGGIYLLAKSISRHSGQVSLIVAFASPLIYSYFHVAIHPNSLSLFMVPLLLYFYHKTRSTLHQRFPNSVLLVLLAFTIVFFHPITTLLAIVVLLALWLGYSLCSHLPGW